MASLPRFHFHFHFLCRAYQSLRWRRIGGAPVSGGGVRNGLCAELCIW
jgi:hypothetical protein